MIDLLPNDYFVGDVGDKAALEAFAAKVIADYGRVNVLVNNALPLTRGLDTCTYEEFNQALRVGVTAPFYLTNRFSPCFAPGASIINISSSRDRMSQPQTESYTAAKGGIAALTHALAVSLAGRVRVNSISPGWIRSSHRLSGAAGLTRPSPATRDRTHPSIPRGAWGIRWTSPTWCCISHPTRRGSSRAKTSASTAA